MWSSADRGHRDAQAHTVHRGAGVRRRRLAPGKLADLVIIDGALHDLRELRGRIRRVILGGRQIR